MAVVYFVFQRESLIFDEQNLLAGSILNINLGGQHMLNPFSCNPASFTAIVRPMIEYIGGSQNFLNMKFLRGLMYMRKETFIRSLLLMENFRKSVPFHYFCVCMNNVRNVDLLFSTKQFSFC